ncbi:DNA-binding response regulator, NarL/FixJ family, contains REC and HTH domains [Spirosomataceae bacterium TFI 002]|nr:DNA-binding response regulator, NarL/FixJ family, contains REC and HTH domains [Spirosomataceae bacterium TFI 002]
MHVVLVDDHTIILDSLGLLLSTMDSINEITTFDDPQEALLYIEANSLDLLVTDFEMPDMNGCDLAQKAKKIKPDLNVLMLTVSEDMETIKCAYKSGILGYVMKKAGKLELKEAIETVAEGNRYYNKALLMQLINSEDGLGSTEVEVEEVKTELTNREVQIVRLMATELSSLEIAQELFLSPATVERHRHNIIKKLGVKSSIGVMKYAFEQKLI